MPKIFSLAPFPYNIMSEYVTLFFPHDIRLMFLLLMQIRPCLTGCATVAAVTLTAKRWALPHWIKTISMTSREKRKKEWRESKSAGQKRRILFFPSCFFLETREFFFSLQQHLWDFLFFLLSDQTASFDNNFSLSLFVKKLQLSAFYSSVPIFGPTPKSPIPQDLQ